MPKKTDIWMPLYIGDYLRDTQHLSREDHGSYMLLIMQYWTKGPLPDDDEDLANVAKCPLELWKASVRRRIAAFFDVKDGFWRHNRIDAELLEAKNNSNIKRENALKRWGKTPQKDANASANVDATGHANEVQTPCPSPSPSPSNNALTGGAPENAGEFAEIPDALEVTVYGKMHGATEETCRNFFNHHQNNRLWLNQFQRLIDWQRKLLTWRDQDRAKQANSPAPSAPQAQAPSPAPAVPKRRQRWQIQADMDAITKRINELVNNRTWARSEELKSDCTRRIEELKKDKKALQDEFDGAE